MKMFRRNGMNYKNSSQETLGITYVSLAVVHVFYTKGAREIIWASYPVLDTDN